MKTCRRFMVRNCLFEAVVAFTLVWCLERLVLCPDRFRSPFHLEEGQLTRIA